MADTIDSRVDDLGCVRLPAFAGVRVQCMPFVWGDRASLPDMLGAWANEVQWLCGALPREHGGVGYLTIDEAYVRPGEHHRRPGLHVDGVHGDGLVGTWGGGGFSAGAGKGGVLMAASHFGAVAWRQRFDGKPGFDGDCAHLASQCDPSAAVPLKPERCFWLSPYAVHETLPAETHQLRQFVRLSTPNDGAWFENYTPNPLGVRPTGPIYPPRTREMGHRS